MGFDQVFPSSVERATFTGGYFWPFWAPVAVAHLRPQKHKQVSVGGLQKKRLCVSSQNHDSCPGRKFDCSTCRLLATRHPLDQRISKTECRSRLSRVSPVSGFLGFLLLSAPGLCILFANASCPAHKILPSRQLRHRRRIPQAHGLNPLINRLFLPSRSQRDALNCARSSRSKFHLKPHGPLHRGWA